MGSLVTPEVAVLYDWRGQRGPKLKFSGLKTVINMIFGKFEDTFNLVILHWILFYSLSKGFPFLTHMLSDFEGK